ncbi:hypothetical protein CLU96_1246 [Chryseobacterium sp. 52]|uniref:hypothetical protein n=1 Tax=Chryseobacterium sp. 52 TaxID=2035213 RepID=UPI000C17B20C|nr:hypothetical protein [Chryseobacterium sp. 52]PIF44305.1 hypothetical protein CLU96_1246 [Chryseobacterium sp. 52]
MITIEKLGDVENVTVATFGNGTMRVTSGEAKDKTYKGLFLGDSELPHAIGEVGEPTPTTNEFLPKIAIHFHSKESFDVFYHYVENLRKDFESE